MLLPFLVRAAGCVCDVSTAPSVVIVEMHAPSPKTLELRLNQDPKAQDTGLLEAHYAKTQSHGVTIYVSEDIWQEGIMAADLAAYDGLAKAIRPDGTIDLSQNPDVLDMVRSEASKFGYDFQASDSANLALSRSYTFQVGDRTVEASASATTQPDKTGRGSNSLRPLNHETDKRSVPRNPLWRPDALAHVEFYMYGRAAGNREVQTLAYTDALDAIEGHFKKFLAALKVKATKLNNLVGGFDVGKSYGKSFSQLPQSIQDQISNDNYRQLGFKSPSDLAAFLADGTLASSRGSLVLELGVMANGVHLCIGMP